MGFKIAVIGAGSVGFNDGMLLQMGKTRKFLTIKNLMLQ